MKDLWKYGLIDGEKIIDCQTTEDTNPFLTTESSFCLRIEIDNKLFNVKYKMSIVYSVVHQLPELLFSVYDLTNGQEVLDVEKVLQ